VFVFAKMNRRYSFAELLVAVIAAAVAVAMGMMFFGGGEQGSGDSNKSGSGVNPPAPTLKELIGTLTRDKEAFEDLPFRDVIEATTGNQVIPFDPTQPADAELLSAIEEALDAAFEEFNKTGSPTNDEARINEVSSHFEDAMMESLNRTPGIRCEHPPTASGKVQRSGYPDLKIVHEESSLVVYLDPKLVARGSFESAFRSFYFTPRIETNKVLDDACHLLVGIEHNAEVGAWKFLDWHLVDLYGFHVQLKAEFQSGNRELYRKDQIIKSGGEKMPQ
jgi:hypothetical protein